MHANIRNNEIIDFNSMYLDEDIIRVETTEQMYELYQQDHSTVIYKDGKIIENPNFEAEQSEKRQEQFKQEFFNTSLGYIRRKVTMANGDVKDFLTDLLPSIAMGIQLNQPVTIITYTEPDFTEEVTNLVKYQEVKQATVEFVQECFTQLNKDFTGDINSGEEPIEGDNALVEPEENEESEE